MTSPRSVRAARERGFTIIEVLVALVIIAILAVVVSRAVLSSSGAQMHAKDVSRETSMSEGAMERVQSDGTWARRSDCKAALSATNPCYITSIAVDCTTPTDAQGWCTVSPDGQQNFRVRVSATGYDSPADGVGTNVNGPDPDRDGLVPDFYHVVVEVQPQLGTGQFDTSRTRRLDGDVNPVTRANAGSVEVRACRLVNQVDHREPVTHCPVNQTSPMQPPVDITALGNDRFRAIGSSASSVDGLAFLSATTAMRQLQYAPVSGVSFTLIPTTDTGARDPSRSNASGVTASNGVAVVDDVIAGSYDITFSGAPAGSVAWNDHSLPGDGKLSVSTGTTTHVSQLFEPTPRSVTINFSFRLLSLLAHFLNDPNPAVTGDVVRPGLDGDHYLRLVAAPLERVPLFGVNPPGKVTGDGVMMHVAENQASATFTNVAPGLYAAYLVDGRDTTTSFEKKNVQANRLSSQGQTATFQDSDGPAEDLTWIWVDPNGTVTAGKDGGGTSSQIWLNQFETDCEPIPLCGGGGGGGGGGGASPSGGSGGL